MNKRIYICAPLAGNTGNNVERVVVAVKKLMREYRMAGVKMPVFIVPHLALNGITFDECGEIDREWGMECCMELLRLCDEVIVLGELVTPGMAQELDEARQLEMKARWRVDL